MELNCTVCLDRLKYPLGKPDNCEHKFCFKCISDWLKKRSQCPLCGGTPKYLIKINENEKETKIPVKKRTAKQFENELLVREQLEDQSGSSDEVEDITIQYASCRLCRRSDNEHLLLLCDGNVGQNADGSVIRCNVAYHCYCLPEKLDQIPEDDWFCPFCAVKPENAKHLAEQTNLNTLPASAVDTNNSLVIKNETDARQDSNCHPNESSKQDDMEMKTIKYNNITNFESTVACGVCGDSDAESESMESNCSSENSELCSETDESASNYDDDYEETDLDNIIESSNDSEDWEAETTNGNFDDDKVDYEESDESDSEYQRIRSKFRNGCTRRRTNRNRSKTVYSAEKVSGFITKTKSKSGKTMTTYHRFDLTRRHST
uniref:RING-type domain-containing protein n=1 Tax=Onchocerca volvulus TaxID=6282 RepID=A0A8R1TS75_ONCVO